MKFQAIVFDLDGTIIDTDWIWKRSIEDLFTEYKTCFTSKVKEKLDKNLRAHGLAFACTIIRDEAKITDPDEIIIERLKKNACRLYQTDLKFVDGFPEFYDKVCFHNLKIGVATNSDPKLLGYAKQRLNLKFFFGDHIYDIEKVDYRYKPDPAIYLFAAQELDVAPEYCIVIEDSPTGVTAAKDAGMFCIAINTADVDQPFGHAHIVVDSYDQISLKKLLK